MPNATDGNENKPNLNALRIAYLKSSCTLGLNTRFSEQKKY